MSNKTYDALKRFAGVWLPLVTAIVLGVGEIWNIEILATIGATMTMVDVALGVALEKLSNDYQNRMEG